MPDAQALSAVEAMLRRVEAQQVLFAATPSRLALQQLELLEPGGEPLHINVWRNHAIEGMLPLMQPYLRFAGIRAEFQLSDYDDSLLFGGHGAAELEVLWLDSTPYLARMPLVEWRDWLAARLRALRALSSAPVVLATWMPAGQGDDGTALLQAVADAVPGVYFADLAQPCADEGVALTDLRSSMVAGTPLGRKAQLLLARKLACHWLPAAALAPVKAIALDLDHTLHTGVLGEDGVAGVVVGPAHAALQRSLHAQGGRGTYLALVSRNERADVEALFAGRSADYPLAWSDFSAIEVSWEPKAQALARIAERLRIAPDAMLFVDDNPGELAAVAAALPGIRTVHAAEDAAQTERAIAGYPGLWRWRLGAEDQYRADDLKASVEREVLRAQAADGEAYFRELGIALEMRFNPAQLLHRAADLCRKTNQFNLALARLSESEVAERMQRSEAGVVTVRMQDRLSDSGVVAVLVAVREGPRLRIEELCVSCRAMGRQLEDTLVLSAIAGMPPFAGCEEVVFTVRHGPRNQPALAWLGALLWQREDPPAEGDHILPAATVRSFRASAHVAIHWEKDTP